MIRSRKGSHMTIGIALLISAAAGLWVLAFGAILIGATSIWSFVIAVIVEWREWGAHLVGLTIIAVLTTLRFTLLMVFQGNKAADRDVV